MPVPRRNVCVRTHEEMPHTYVRTEVPHTYQVCNKHRDSSKVHFLSTGYVYAQMYVGCGVAIFNENPTVVISWGEGSTSDQVHHESPLHLKTLQSAPSSPSLDWISFMLMLTYRHVL